MKLIPPRLYLGRDCMELHIQIMYYIIGCIT